MTEKIFQVDAFTDTPFRGNPAAVCLLKKSRDENWMQSMAAEMNLSETAFLVPDSGGFQLRWFTPTVEVALCGHATLASAHVLWEQRVLQEKAQARFETKSGTLTADKRGDQIELNFPSVPSAPVEAPKELLQALGATPTYSSKGRFDYLLEFKSEDEIRGMKPDFATLFKLPVRGIIVTARSKSPEFDFISRFFAPGSGIAEDPVTGSAHCALAPYWTAKLGKANLVGYQASARGGRVATRLEGDRVILGGQAVTVFRGEITTWPGL